MMTYRTAPHPSVSSADDPAMPPTADYTYRIVPDADSAGYWVERGHYRDGTWFRQLHYRAWRATYAEARAERNRAMREEGMTL